MAAPQTQSVWRAPRVSLRFWPVFLRNLLVWRKLAIPSLVGNIAEPLMWLVAFGYGMGALVGQIRDRRVITYGRNPQADVRLVDLENRDGVQHFAVEIRDRIRMTHLRIDGLELPMPGEHNALNATAAIAVADFAKQRKVLFIAAEPLTDKIVWDQGNAYTFRLRTSTYMQTAMLIPDAAKLNKKRWAIVYPNYEYGQSAAATFKELMKAAQPDIEFVGEQATPLGKVDAGSVSQALADATSGWVTLMSRPT